MTKLSKLQAQTIHGNLQGQFKRIEDYSDEELEATLIVLGNNETYKLLNFIDAYFERRRRRQLAEAHR